MPAPKHNKFWEARTTHGRDKLFADEEILWAAAVEYFEWVEENPLQGAKLFKIKNDEDKDEIIEESYSKMRAMTIEGLRLFLDISHTTWANYKQHKDFIAVTEKIDDVIRSQKFAGAAADLLNANIIARDLGLRDRTETEHKGNVGVTDLTEEGLDDRIKQLERLREQGG